MIILSAISLATSIPIAYRTSPSWSIVFPDLPDQPVDISVTVSVILSDETGKYIVDESILATNTEQPVTNDLAVAGHILRYLQIINKALENFTPSNRSLFELSKVIRVTIRESIIYRNGTQTGTPNIHIDNFAGGYIGEDGVAYDGIFMANSVEYSCLIFDVLLSDKTEYYQRYNQQVIRYFMNKYGLDEEQVVFTEASRLYWITGKTPHGPIGVAEDCVRQFIGISVGSYLDEEEMVKIKQHITK
jgi:hypothetical protein